jgi:hypothetical protein
MTVALRYDSLDADVRKQMIAELTQDIDNARVYLSDQLNDEGRNAWPNLLWEAAESHNDNWLSAQIRRHNYVEAGEARGGGKGKPAADPATMLAQSEFNRLYVRGVCADALAKGKSDVDVYLGQANADISANAQAKVGKRLPARKLLNAARNATDAETPFGLPSDEFCFLTVKR